MENLVDYIVQGDKKKYNVINVKSIYISGDVSQLIASDLVSFFGSGLHKEMKASKNCLNLENIVDGTGIISIISTFHYLNKHHNYPKPTIAGANKKVRKMIKTIGETKSFNYVKTTDEL